MEPEERREADTRGPTETFTTTLLKGRYLLGPELGRGGFGITYLASDQDVASRKVVVKVLNDRRAADSWHVKKFRGEMEALSRIDHPNVVGVIDFGESADGQQFLVMQFAAGETLRSMLRRGTPALAAAAGLFSQMGSALSAAHEAGVIHRDIKPENVMVRVTPDGGCQIKLVDFGVASLFVAESDTLTAVVSGTYGYMAPEQFEGRSSPLSDIYQMGIVAYEVVTGHQPFRASNPVAVALAQREPLKKRPRDLRRELPLAAEQAILKALSLNPAERFQSAKDFGEALGSALMGPAPRPGRMRAPVPVPKRWGALLIAAGTIALAIAGYLEWPLKSGGDLVAVLPFENRTGDPALDYLAGGVTESLIDDLSRIPTLRVSAFGSVRKYEGRRVDARAAGRDLGARRLIDGSITNRGGELFINTELIDVKIGTRTWGNAYSTKLSSVVEIMQTFSNEVTDQLRLKLSGTLKQRLKRQYAVGSRSYETYLRARFYLNKRTAADFRQAIQYFQDVLASDPDYAPAQAGLADTYARMAVFGPFLSGAEPREALERSKAAAKAALQLDGTLAEAYNALAMSEVRADYDWDAAQGDYLRSIELNPNFAETHENYALELAALGRSQDALVEIEKAEEMEPDNSHFRAAHGLILYMGRKYDESLKIYAAIANTPKGVGRVADVMAMNYWMKSMPAEALKVLTQMPPGMPELTTPLTITAYARLNQFAQARKLYDDFYLHGGRSWWYHLAVAHLSMRKPDDAVRDIENAYEERWGDTIWIGVDPLFDELRPSPGFKKVLAAVKLAPKGLQ